MNVENVNATIAAIAAAPEGQFDMGRLFHGCGTPACIAGYAAALAMDEDPQIEDENWDIESAASAFLGIDEYQESQLFFPHILGIARIAAMPGDRDFVTRDHALAVLRNFAETDVINWRIGK